MPVDANRPGSNAEYDLALIGHFSRDINIARGIETRRSGGAVYYGSIAAAKAGAKVAVITKVPEDDIPLLSPMRDAGVDIFPVVSERGTSIRNTYLDDTLERRNCEAISFAGAYAMEMLPPISAKIWHMAGLIRGEVDLDLMKALSGSGKLSADAQGFVRAISGSAMIYEDWKDKAAAMPLLDFFKADAAEAEILTGLSDIRDAAKSLADMGAKEIALTHNGGLLTLAGGEFCDAPFTPRQMLGRTGRGDTTMCSYLARRLTRSPQESCRFAAALCSLKMEQDSPFSGSIEDVLRKIEEQTS